MAQSAKNWAEQERIARDWSAWDPASANAWLFLAEASYEQDDAEHAAEYLGRVPPDDPKAIPAYLEQTNLEWTHLNEPLKGLATCERILGIDSRVLDAHGRIISFYTMTAQRVEMIAAIRRAIASGAEPPEVYTYLMLSESLSFTNASELVARWLSSAPENEQLRVGLGVQTALSLAQNAASTGNADARELEAAAVHRLEEFLETYPNNPVLLGFLLEHYQVAGDTDQVGRLLARVPDSAANDHLLWVFRGWYHAINQEFEEAEQAFREALRLFPLSERGHHEYASLLRQLQRSDDTLREQELAITGKKIRTRLLERSNARELTHALLVEIAAYARACGDEQVATALQGRIHAR